MLRLLLLAFAPAAWAIQAGDIRGLSIAVEPIAEPVVVDGVPMRIQHAHGEDVATLAARIGHRWRSEGGVVRQLQSGSWQVLSRWNHGSSEVIQWRSTAGDAQLLYSSLDTTRGTTVPVPPPFNLPRRCAWGRSVEGNAPQGFYSQRSARCPVASGRMHSLLRDSLRSQGWSIHRETAATIEVSRNDVQGSVLVSAGSNPGESTLVWIGTGKAGKFR